MTVTETYSEIYKVRHREEHVWINASVSNGNWLFGEKLTIEAILSIILHCVLAPDINSGIAAGLWVART